MIHGRFSARLILSLACVAILAGRSHAEPHINARVSSSEVTLNSSITLVLDVSGVSDVGAAPDLNLPDFQVQRAGQTVSYQWVNGQAASLVSFNYVLTPLKTGTLTIPSLTLSIGGKNYSTQPIPIEVRADGAAPTGGAAAQGGGRAVQVPSEGLRPIFMTASLDTSRLYVGQQAILRVQFLRRPEIRLASQARYNQPDMTGFLVEPLQQQEYTTTINGAQYTVSEIPYVLFPTSDGDFAIGQASVEVAVRTEADPFDPNSFFQSFFGRSQVVKLTTRAIPVNVRALPKNKPAGFSGAVGRFKIRGKVDQTELEVGKPFNLILTIEGVGNIKAIKEPPLPELKGFRRYETLSSSKVNKEGKFLHGSKEFKTLMIPQVSGTLTIPSVPFVYFNPEQANYVTEMTPEISLNVKPGTLSKSDRDLVAEPADQPASAEGVRVVEKDIRFLKPGQVAPARPPLFHRPFFYLLNMFPPLFALVALLVRRQSRRRVMNAAEYRFRGAAKTAARTLRQARTHAKDPDPTTFYSLVHNALAGYLADKMGLSPSGLVWDDLDRRLGERGVDADLRSRARSVFEEADMARFATSSFTDAAREDSLKNAEEVIQRLEKALPR